MKLANQIEQIIRKVTGVKKGYIPLSEPIFTGNELEYVTECIKTGWVSSAGSYVNKFEQMLQDFTGINHAIATVNGTAALHICLLLANVKQGHEVLCQALTFVATANAISYCGATPHFVDIETISLGICPIKLEQYLSNNTTIKNNKCINNKTGKQIKALVAMHTFGHPSQLDELLSICNKYHLIMIEDAAEAIGSLYKEKHVGNHGLLSALSFNGNKTITCGGGGAILTNSDELARKAKHLTTTGKTSHKWEYHHDCIAYNYRMPNINAALGCGQLETLPEALKQKRILAENYRILFSEISNINFLSEPDYAKSNYWLNSIFITNTDETGDNSNLKNTILNNMNENKIQIRPPWQLLSTLPMYQLSPKSDLSTSQIISEKLINIPSVQRFNKL